MLFYIFFFSDSKKMLKLTVFLLLVQLAHSITVQNFTFPPLEFFQSSQQAMAPKLAKLEKMQVDPIQSNAKTDMHLIEFLFLNMDFNFENSVPKSDKMTYKLPDIWNMKNKTEIR